MTDQVWGLKVEGNALPPTDLYGELELATTTTTTILQIVMPPDSYARLNIEVIGKAVTGSEVGFAWKSARYVRAGSAAPGSGVVADVQTADTTAFAVSFATDVDGRVQVQVTADATPIGRADPVRVFARATVLIATSS